MNQFVILLAVLAFNIGCKASLFPPPNASWLDIGPVVLPSEPWEETAVQEPQVYWDVYNQEFRMYYRGGWGNQSVGVATSKTGLTWKKYEHNPIYGAGGSGVDGLNEGGQPYVFREDVNKYWLFATGPGHMNIAFSEDGFSWKTQKSNIKFPSGCSLWGNRAVWSEQQDKTNKNNVTTKITTFYMLQEAGWSGGVWKIFLYTSNDTLNWVIRNQGLPLSSLQLGLGDGMFGGPSIANVNGTTAPKNESGIYHLWYHAAPEGNNPKVLPTDIYHAVSKDLITWKISLCEAPVLRHSGKGAEYDQTADPSAIITPDGGAFLYYDADNNNNGRASIGMALNKPDPNHLIDNSYHLDKDITLDII